MKNQLKKSNLTFNEYTLKANGADRIKYSLKSFSKPGTVQRRQPNLDDLLTGLAAAAGKKSFLVFKHNKYIIVPTENIAFFYVKHESSMIMSFNQQEYSVNHSLKQIEDSLTAGNFFRLNRRYLINFYAIKEAEHYFARKLLVKLTVPAPDKLLVPKEKVSDFLHWLENR